MSLPHWILTNIYPSLESPEFDAALKKYAALLDDLDRFMDERGIAANGKTDSAGETVNGYLDRMNAALELRWTLWSYVTGYVTTDSYNQLAARLLSQLDALNARSRKQDVRFKGWLASLADRQPPIWEEAGVARAHAFYLREAVEQSRYLMSEAEESLAADLALSGISAWSRLQGTVTSQVKVEFSQNGKTETLPITALQNLSHDPDPNVRRRAHEAELKAWASVREPLAAAMNGVKGTIATLNKRRGRKDALHQPLDDARMDAATLEAMMSAMRDSFPAFRQYLKAKAQRLGIESLTWWDLFAPVGGSERHYSWPETQTFVVEQFRTFSDRLAALAGRAFDEGWIDAESRDGKRGGAFCMKVPAKKESRVLCNFDGSLDQVFTVAHELGHAFHNECLKDNTVLQNITPMTLAETASIFCETLMTEAALKRAASPAEELTILETFLQGATQVIVDISSRFMFEREVFERRAGAELSADDFCEIMTRAQKATYGDGLDERTLHPYMWAWKPHYYRAELQFYNFPYAFGLLFGLGLYAVYQQRGPAFVPNYEKLLASTGQDTPANLAARFGINIRDRKFWEDSLRVIERRIEQYCQL
jgi:pepF/M3 family oligoendopeptidase